MVPEWLWVTATLVTGFSYPIYLVSRAVRRCLLKLCDDDDDEPPQPQPAVHPQPHSGGASGHDHHRARRQRDRRRRHGGGRSSSSSHSHSSSDSDSGPPLQAPSPPRRTSLTNLKPQPYN